MGNGKNYSKNKFKILFHKIKVAKMNYHGIKDDIVVPQVSVCVDHSNNIKRDIHI